VPARQEASKGQGASRQWVPGSLQVPVGRVVVPTMEPAGDREPGSQKASVPESQGARKQVWGPGSKKASKGPGRGARRDPWSKRPGSQHWDRDPAMGQNGSVE